MPRYQSNVSHTVSPWWVRGLIALGVVAFMVGVMANAAQSAVLNASYYQKVLDDEQAYERAFAELSRDPALAGATSDLLGGTELPFVDQIPGLLVAAIPVQLVESMVDDALEDIIEYLKDNKELELTLDITPFVDGVGSTGLDAAIDGLGDLGGDGGLIPEDFEEDIDDILDGFLDEGRRLPGLLPGRAEDRRRPEGSGLALRTGDGFAESAHTAPPAALFDIKESRFVHAVEINGETHYLLGPPETVLKKVDEALWAVQLVASNSYWLRPVGIALFIAALGGLIFISRRDSRAMAKRVGLMLTIAGTLVFAGWMVGMPLIQGTVIDAAFEGSSVPSESFDTLARDVLNRSVSNLTPYVLLPALVAAGIGVGLLVAWRIGGRGRRTVTA